MKTSVAFVAVAAALSGCYVIPIDPHHLPSQAAGHGASPVVLSAPLPYPSVLRARLYPLNETAGKMGALTAIVSDSSNGHATFQLTHAGELLQGEASRVPSSYPGFGKVHREVYNDGAMPTGQRGIASAAGPRGTFVNCEYALLGPNRGTGACIFSNGARYQLHFGS